MNRLVLQDDDLIVHRQSDVEPVLDRIKAIQDDRAWDSKDGSLRQVGKVVSHLFVELCHKHGVTWNQVMRDDDLQEKMLIRYFAEYPAFKVAPGRNL